MVRECAAENVKGMEDPTLIDETPFTLDGYLQPFSFNSKVHNHEAHVDTGNVVRTNLMPGNRKKEYEEMHLEFSGPAI